MTIPIEHARRATKHALQVVSASARTQSGVVDVLNDPGSGYSEDYRAKHVEARDRLRQAVELIEAALAILG